MPLWFDVTALIVCFVAVLGVVIGYIGMFLNKAWLGAVGVFITFFSVCGFILFALAVTLIDILF